MKHTIINIVIATYLITSTSCSAMEIQKSNTPTTKEITCVKYAQHAQYLRRDRIIAGNPRGCHIINPITDKKITEICTICPAHIAVHPDKTKVALSHNTEITMYSYDHDTDKVEKIWFFNTFLPQNSLYSSHFSPFDETIITRHSKIFGFLKHNYITNKSTCWDNPYSTTFPPIVAFHPTEQRLCLAHSSGIVSTHEYSKIDILNTFKIEGHHHYFCEYNANGSIIACGKKASLYLCYPSTKKKYKIPKKNEKYWWHCIAFHPNGSVLTTLSSPNNILQHWDIKTRQVIEEIPLSDKQPLNNQNICFLSDGTELMITTSKCIIMPMSFNVLYPPSLQKRLLYTLFVLKNVPNLEKSLPMDVVTLLMHAMLTVLRC